MLSQHSAYKEARNQLTIACLALQAIDRPLFKDFWERFRECLTLLRDKHQRTVYRQALLLTLELSDTQQISMLPRTYALQLYYNALLVVELQAT